jgi:hypothetical protein
MKILLLIPMFSLLTFFTPFSKNDFRHLKNSTSSCTIHTTTNTVDCELNLEYVINCASGATFKHPALIEVGSTSIPFVYDVVLDPCEDCWVARINIYDCNGSPVGTITPVTNSCLTIPASACCGVDRCICIDDLGQISQISDGHCP